MFDCYRMSARFIVATSIVSAALSIAASASAQEAHGVIAYGETRQGNGIAYGFAWNFPAKDAAHAEAMDACLSSGGTNCMEAAWSQNGCVALAIDPQGIAAGRPGMTSEQAEARALQACEAAGGTGCTIAGSICVTPGGDPGTYSGSESTVPAQRAQTTPALPAEEPLSREERVVVQQALNALGFDAGPADGIFGERTLAAIWEWQTASGHEATGHVTREEFAVLAAAGTSLDEEIESWQEAADTASNNVLCFDTETGPQCEDDLGYLTRDEADAMTEAGEASREGQAAALSPKCAGMQKGATCWMEFADPPGCYIFNYYYNPPGTATWSGACSDGVAVGRGTWSWQLTAGSGEGTGTLVHGRLHGHWVERWASGFVSEGPYVDGMRNGHWVLRSPDGIVYEGSYVDGKENGPWFVRLADGGCMVYHYSHGEITGGSDC